MPWMALDPVFYNERARTANMREGSLGKMREISRTKMTGRNLILPGTVLTSKHPGLDLHTLAK